MQNPQVLKIDGMLETTFSLKTQKNTEHGRH